MWLFCSPAAGAADAPATRRLAVMVSDPVCNYCCSRVQHGVPSLRTLLHDNTCIHPPAAALCSRCLQALQTPRRVQAASTSVTWASFGVLIQPMVPIVVCLASICSIAGLDVPRSCCKHPGLFQSCKAYASAAVPMLAVY
jgi:hypothetical protein